MEVDRELCPDPLVAALPACPVQEDVIAVLRHMLQQVVGEAQVGRGQAQNFPQLAVVDLDAGLREKPLERFDSALDNFPSRLTSSTSTTASLRCLCCRKRTLVAPATKPRTDTSDRRWCCCSAMYGRHR